jgi:hypothetical protein
MTTKQNPTKRCPKCGSGNVSGLVAAFWVSMDDVHDDIKWTTESEIGPERLCRACEHSWNDGEEEGHA